MALNTQKHNLERAVFLRTFSRDENKVQAEFFSNILHLKHWITLDLTKPQFFDIDQDEIKYLTKLLICTFKRFEIALHQIELLIVDLADKFENPQQNTHLHNSLSALRQLSLDDYKGYGHFDFLYKNKVIIFQPPQEKLQRKG
jgi:hypothetical protein